jgi:hypothetical protein
MLLAKKLIGFWESHVWIPSAQKWQPEVPAGQPDIQHS